LITDLAIAETRKENEHFVSEEFVCRIIATPVVLNGEQVHGSRTAIFDFRTPYRTSASDGRQ